MKWKRSAAADDTASRTRTTSPSRARPHLNLMDLVLRTAPPRVRVILTGSLSLSPPLPRHRLAATEGETTSGSEGPSDKVPAFRALPLLARISGDASPRG